MARSKPASPSQDAAATSDAGGCIDADCPESEQLSSIKVVVRVRPPNGREDGDATCVQSLGDKELVLTGDDKTQRKFAFSLVAGPDTDQEFMFQAAGADCVASCLAGFNSALLAYGMTGSGKSFTMGTSSCAAEGDSRGLTQRIFEALFAGLDELERIQGGSCERKLECCFFEIYNEEINDLLDPAKKNLDIRGGRPEERYVQGLSKVEVSGVADVLALLKKGMAQRAVAETNMNDLSSRSHSVLGCELRVTVVDASGGAHSRRSRLYLVDLAGSERQKQTGAVGLRFKEACSINSSLSVLGDVIKGLADRSSGKEVRHVRFRDSKLTRLLEDSLGGNSKTTLIANISPALRHSSVTLQTLQFAEKAAGIKNQVVANEDIIGGAAMVKKLQAEIQWLQKKLAAVQQGSGIACRAVKLERQVSELELQNRELQSTLEGWEADAAETAREREAQREALEQAELAKAELQQRAQQLAEEHAQLRSDKEGLEAEVSQLAAAQQQLEEERSRQQEEIEGLQSELARLAAAQQQLQEERSRQHEEIERLQSELARLIAAQQHLEEERSRQQEEIEGLQAERSQQEEEMERLREQAAALAEALAVAQAASQDAKTGQPEQQEEMDRLWCQLASLAEELNAAQAASQVLLKGRAAAQQEREELLSINIELQSELARLREDCQKDQAALHKAKQQLIQQAEQHEAALAAAHAATTAAEGEGRRLGAELQAAVAAVAELQRERDRLQAQLQLQQQAAAGFKEVHRQLRSTQAKLSAAAAATEDYRANEAELQARLKAKSANAEGLRSQLSQQLTAQQVAAAEHEQQLQSELASLRAELEALRQAAAEAQRSREAALREALDAAAADRAALQAAAERDIEAARQEASELRLQLEAALAVQQAPESQQAPNAAAAPQAQPVGGLPGGEEAQGEDEKQEEEGEQGVGPSAVCALKAQFQLGQQTASLRRQLRESRQAQVQAAAEAAALRQELAEALGKLQGSRFADPSAGPAAAEAGAAGEEAAADLSRGGEGERGNQQQPAGPGGEQQQHPARRRRLLPNASWMRDPPAAAGEEQEEGPAAARRGRGQQAKAKEAPGAPKRVKPVLHTTNHYHYHTHPPPK